MAWGNPGSGSHSEVDGWIARLKRRDPTFTSLHILSFRRLTTDNFVRLFEAIARNNTLTELGCSGHQLDVRALGALSDMLQANHTLRRLTFGSAHQFGEHPDHLAIVAEGLAANRGLQELDLEYKDLSLAHVSALRLILTRPAGWEVLKLGRNKLGDEAIARLLGPILAAGSAAGPGTLVSRIADLDLTDNTIQAQGAADIARWLTTPVPATVAQSVSRLGSVKAFKLSYNPLGTEGMAHITQALGSDNTTLERLWLIDCIQPDEGAATTAAAAELASVTTNSDGVSEVAADTHAVLPWIESLRTSLRRNTTLRGLWLHRCQLGDNGLVHLSQGLGRHAPKSRLATLSLRDNRITDTGVVALAQALADDTVATSSLTNSSNDDDDNTPSSVRKLDLSENRISPAGLAHLLQCPQLGELTLYANQVAIAGPIPELSNGDNAGALRRLDLSCNDIEIPGFEYFSRALSAGLLPALEILEVAGNASQDQQSAWDPLVDQLTEQRPTLKVYWKKYESADNSEAWPSMPA
ncbi:hypothetical protein H4R33_004886 [Dimargaris cristalligena]|nr:hypothetical protein H4R33_004886 [Dimargaris cristalligena]